MADCNNDTSNTSGKQPRHRKPETRAKLIVAKPVVSCDDGSMMTAYLVDATEIKDVDFLKEKRMDSEAKNIMITNTDAIVLWWYAVQGMAYNNATEISTAVICKTFGWGRKRVEEARNYLKEKELIKNVSGNIYIINPYYASRISPVYRPALENAWRKGTMRYFDDDRSAIDRERKEKKKGVAPAVEPVHEPVATEPAREQYVDGEQMLLTDLPQLKKAEEEAAFVADAQQYIKELRRQKARERQRLCRERKRQREREALETATVHVRQVDEYAPWEVIPEERYVKKREEDHDFGDMSFV